MALIGPNGTGKSTLVKTILGELDPLAGRFDPGAGVVIGYLAQRHVGAGFGLMDETQTVLDSLLGDQEPAPDPGPHLFGPIPLPGG